MSALVVPSGECLRDGRCADPIVSNLAPLYLAAYLPVLTLLSVVLGLPAMVYKALSGVSAVVLRSFLSSNDLI